MLRHTDTSTTADGYFSHCHSVLEPSNFCDTLFMLKVPRQVKLGVFRCSRSKGLLFSAAVACKSEAISAHCPLLSARRRGRRGGEPLLGTHCAMQLQRQILKPRLQSTEGISRGSRRIGLRRGDDAG